MDNGTMVDAFKYLDYFGLAKKSLVSKRFRNVIQTHRHSLPRLYVQSVRMNLTERRVKPIFGPRSRIEILGKKLSAEEYDEWVIRNQYSKQVPLKGQVVQKESKQNDCDVYQLYAAYHKDKPCPKRGRMYKQGSNDLRRPTYVIHVEVEFNHEHWPLFQHFVRLISDPFVRIDEMGLTYQNDVMNLLVETINPDRGRLQCNRLNGNHHGNPQKFFDWIKDHMTIYDHLYINNNIDSNQELLNFCLTGGRCASTMSVCFSDFFEVVVDLVKKFLDLKNRDEYQLVQSIENFKMGDEGIRIVEVMKREYPTCVVKEERNDGSTTYDFEFNNDEIGKKLQLTVKHSFSTESYTTNKIFSR